MDMTYLILHIEEKYTTQNVQITVRSVDVEDITVNGTSLMED